MSQIDDNKTLIRRAAEFHNARDRENFLACYSPELRIRFGEQEVVVGPDQHWDAVLSWAEVFDGFAESIVQMVAEDDRVFLRSLYSGVHVGVWRGIEPTGRPVEWEAWQVLSISDGLIVEERMLMDTDTLVDRLSAPPGV